MWLKARIRTLFFGRNINWALFWNAYDKDHVYGYSPGKNSIEEEIAVQFVIDTLHLTAEEKILDVGCGDGVFDERLPCQVFGVDFPEVIKHSLTKGVPGSCTNIPVDEIYDKVLVNATLQYVSSKDIDMALREFYRVGNTVLLAFLYDKKGRDLILSTCPRENISQWASATWFVPEKLKKQAEKVGFKATILRGPNGLPQMSRKFHLFLQK